MTDELGFTAPTLPAPTGSPLAPPAAVPLVAPVIEGTSASVAPLPIPTLPPVGGAPKATTVEPLVELDAPTPIEIAAGSSTPKWKAKRKKSPVRKLLGVVSTVAVLGGLGYGGFLGYQKLAPAADEPASLPLDDPDTLIGRSNQLVTQIDENVEEAIILDELGLDPLANPIAASAGASSADAIQSYEFVWSSETSAASHVSADVATGDYQLSDGTSTTRRVGAQVFAQASPLSAWELSPLSTVVPPAVLAGPLQLSDVIPDSIAPWVLGPADAPGGLQTYIIDEPTMFAEAIDVWMAYVTSWGHDPATAAGSPSRDMTVTVQVDPDGRLVAATLDSRTIGGVSSYSLMSMSGLPLVVEEPLAGS